MTEETPATGNDAAPVEQEVNVEGDNTTVEAPSPTEPTTDPESEVGGDDAGNTD